MLSELCQKLWITSANMTIGKAGKQLMADLPQEQVLSDDPPFTRVGVDYFGPFKVERWRGFIREMASYSFV